MSCNLVVNKNICLFEAYVSNLISKVLQGIVRLNFYTYTEKVSIVIYIYNI